VKNDLSSERSNATSTPAELKFFLFLIHLQWLLGQPSRCLQGTSVAGLWHPPLPRACLQRLAVRVAFCIRLSLEVFGLRLYSQIYGCLLNFSGKGRAYINQLSKTFSHPGEAEQSFWYSLKQKGIVFRISSGSFGWGKKCFKT